MKVTGLFFGSFNPIHNGHMAIAHYLLDHEWCGEIWFIVSPHNPFKDDQTLLDEQLRLLMVEAAIAGDSRMKVCDIEFNMPRPSYTMDTLRQLSQRYPRRRFDLIIGSDNLRNFHLWRDYQNILAHYRILVYPRPGTELSSLEAEWPEYHAVVRTVTTPDAASASSCHPGIMLVNAPLSEVSSTSIRARLQQGQDVSADVPPGVLPLLRGYMGRPV